MNCPLCGAPEPSRCAFAAHASAILGVPVAAERPEAEEDVEALLRAEQEREENARSTEYDRQEERGMDRRRGLDRI